MGNTHSAGYHILEDGPLVAPVVKVWSEGSEWVRFVDTISTQVLQVDTTSHEKHRHAFKKAKAIVVRGQTTGEINYISWDTLVRAVEGGSLKVAELVDRKKDYEIHVKWSWGYVTDPQTGKVRDCCYLDPAPDPASGEILRKIDAWSALLASLRQDDSKLIDDDFRLDDVKVKEDVELSADMEDRMKYSPVHVVSRH